jgi:PhzF family phenazine biosynthesis protein
MPASAAAPAPAIPHDAPRRRRFMQVDVFSAEPGRGNPVAVVIDAEGLDTAQMQAFADWTNLSETTFVLPPTQPGADYRLRIFSPGRELPFAGHPTLGSCQAWMAAGGKPSVEGRIVQECGAGLVPIRAGDPADGSARLAFAAPKLRRSGPLPPQERTRIERAFGLEPAEVLADAWCDNGPPWRALLLRSADRLRALRPDVTALHGLDVGLVAAQATDADAKSAADAPSTRNASSDTDTAFEVRAFFSRRGGVTEDPATGSLNAALAQWLIGEGIAPQAYVVAQGTALGRRGRVYVQQAEGQIWVGGDAWVCIEGSLLL